MTECRFERWIAETYPGIKLTDAQHTWACNMDEPSSGPMFIIGGRKQMLSLWREYQAER